MSRVRFSPEFAQAVGEYDAVSLDQDVEGATLREALEKAVARLGPWAEEAIFGVDGGHDVLMPGVDVVVNGKVTTELEARLAPDSDVVVMPPKGHARAFDNV